MKKNLLFLLGFIFLGGSIFAMESNNSNPGDVAIKNHPNAWLATKIAGGTTGTLFGLTGLTALFTFNAFADSVIGRNGFAVRATTRLKFLALSIPVTSVGWKSGETVSKVAWHTVWNGVDKIEKSKK